MALVTGLRLGGNTVPKRGARRRHKALLLGRIRLRSLETPIAPVLAQIPKRKSLCKPFCGGSPGRAVLVLPPHRWNPPRRPLRLRPRPFPAGGLPAGLAEDRGQG